MRVNKEEEGQRLPNYIQSHLSTPLSLKAIKKVIEENGCRINNRLERFASYHVKAGDSVEFTPTSQPELEMLYEDDYLAVLDKPAFLVCESEKGLLGWHLAHRLDKETTGCLLLAKDHDIEKALIALFKNREVEKEYLALVEGCPTSSQASEGIIEEPIEGQPAKTAWKVERKISAKKSLLRCFPETGRTHQIRIHLAAIGHPIIGDWKYKSTTPAKRIMLHAVKIGFVHPIRKQWLSVNAPLPKDFYEALDH